MMRTGFLVREITGSRLPSMVSSMVQRRPRSFEAYASVQNGDVTKDMAEVEDRPTKDIPGPKAWPLLGNMFRFIPYIGKYGNVDLISQMRMLHEEYGDMVKLDGIVNRPPCIFLFSADMCEKMYRVQGTWPMRLAMECLHHYRESRQHIYNGVYGIATSQGKLWHDFRSKVNPHMMQPRTVKVHVGQISEVTGEFVEKMRALRDPETLELPANFTNELYKWALESICSIALNCRLGCLKPNLPADSEPQIMINCVHDMFELMYRLEVLPSLWKLYNTRNLKKFFRVMDTLNGISMKHINRAKEKFRETPSTDSHERSVLEKLLSIDEQTAHIMALDMLTAGVDTTGNMSGALLYYIATNPEKQEKLREEAMSILPDKTSLVTHEMLNETRYSKACIKESLRLFPVAIGNLRTMQSDVSLGGYKIPKGYNLIACHPLISKDPTQFPRPEEYIPERWLRDNKDKAFPLAKEAHPFSYMPFGFGSRTCIGRRFAEMEMETLLLTVVRNFRIEWHHEPLKCKSRFINTLGSPMKYKLIDL